MIRLSSAVFGQNEMLSIKLLGDKLSARQFVGQINEIHSYITVLSKFLELSRPYQSCNLNLSELGTGSNYNFFCNKAIK